jgi:hypothetical protein
MPTKSFLNTDPWLFQARHARDKKCVQNACRKILRYYVKVLGVDRRIISIQISKKQAVRVQTCFIRLRTGTSGGLS